MNAEKNKNSRLLTSLFGHDGEVVLDPVAQSMTIIGSLLALGVTVISPLLLDLSEIFEVSSVQIGLLITAFTTPQIILIPIIGVAADLIGRKWLLAGGLILFGISGTSIGLTESFQTALVLRAIQGIGFAAAMPLTITVLGDYYEGSREATAQGLRTGGLFLVNMLAPVIGAFFMGFAWQLPFLLFFTAIPAGIWICRIMPSETKEHTVNLKDYLGSLVTLIRKPHMLLIFSTFILRFVVFFGYLTYLSFFGKQNLGMTTVGIGLMAALKAITSFIGSIQAGRLSQRMHTVLTAVLAFTISGAGLILAGAVPSIRTLIVGSMLLGIGDGIAAPIQKSLVTNLSHSQVRGGAISLSSTMSSTGKALAPVVMAGVMSLSNVCTVFIVLGVISTATSVILLVVWYMTRHVVELR